MSGLCKWVHEQLERLPMIKFLFKVEHPPENEYISFIIKKEKLRVALETNRGELEWAIIEMEILEVESTSTTS
jgi:hypothetical protein